MTLPLEGMTVVAIEQAVAAPLATRNLADLGARVIKVERIDGGDLARGYDHVVHGTGAHFVWLNRGKESLGRRPQERAGPRHRPASDRQCAMSSCRTWHQVLPSGWGSALTNSVPQEPN